MELTLKSGSIVKLFCEFTTPPKYKYLMIATIEPNLLVFIVNSEINPFIRNNPDLLADQVDIPQCDHLFLEHDSILNCIEAHNAFDLSYLKDEILNSKEIYQGHLAKYCLRNVIEVIEQSVNHSPIVKKQIITAIKSDNNLD